MKFTGALRVLRVLRERTDPEERQHLAGTDGVANPHDSLKRREYFIPLAQNVSAQPIFPVGVGRWMAAANDQRSGPARMWCDGTVETKEREP